jgi:hypothetical protein
MQLSTPVHSKTISNPSARSCTLLITSEDCSPSHAFLPVAIASVPEVRGPLGSVWIPVAHPLLKAKSNLEESISTATVVVAPCARARAKVNNPTAPAPSTSTRSPARRLERLIACRTTESGSANAAASKEQPSGSLDENRECRRMIAVY